MIHHASIPARDPRHVAEVLAELMGGRCYPFPPLPGSFMAVSGDAHGTLIEVYPEGAALTPGQAEDQVGFAGDATAPAAWPFHLLLSVPLSREEIEAIGAREGWRTKFFGRALPGQPPLFHLYELWIENRFMLEIIPETMAAEYERIFDFANLDRLAAARAAE